MKREVGPGMGEGTARNATGSTVRRALPVLFTLSVVMTAVAGNRTQAAFPQTALPVPAGHRVRSTEPLQENSKWIGESAHASRTDGWTGHRAAADELLLCPERPGSSRPPPERFSPPVGGGDDTSALNPMEIGANEPLHQGIWE
jgi:hypothetical protein